MDINKAKDIISKSPKGNKDFKLDDIANINDKVKLSLQMNEDNQTYYYQITYDDLSESNLSESDLENMVSKGWRLLDNKQIFFKTIN